MSEANTPAECPRCGTKNPDNNCKWGECHDYQHRNPIATPANKAPEAPEIVTLWIDADGEHTLFRKYDESLPVDYVPAAKLEEARREARELRIAMEEAIRQAEMEDEDCDPHPLNLRNILREVLQRWPKKNAEKEQEAQCTDTSKQKKKPSSSSTG